MQSPNALFRLALSGRLCLCVFSVENFGFVPEYQTPPRSATGSSIGRYFARRAVEKEPEGISVNESINMSLDGGMELPVLLITQGVLFPETRLRVPIRSKSNVAMLDRFVLNRTVPSKTLVLVAYRTDNQKKVFDIGTVALVEQVTCYTTTTFTQYTLHLLGVSRARIIDYALPVSRAKQLYSTGEISPDKEKELFEAVRAFEATLLGDEHRNVSPVLKSLIVDRQIDAITDVTASLIPGLSYEAQLEFLGTLSTPSRIDQVIEWCKKHAEIAPPRPAPMTLVPEGISLRTEQRRKPRSVTNGTGKDAFDRIKGRIEKLPEHVLERVNEDLSKLQSSGPNSQEAAMIMSYLEFVVDLPWMETTSDSVDIKKARVLLDDSHEGMETVKRRVLEYMAVRSLRDDGSGKNIAGPILCFAGPPGCGKTSVAKAIAESLGRKFERLSLGGIRDEADIRGHRRTYVGAMPGRILQALKHCKTRNPVILLDEVDKLFAGISGSPSAALLEVLDPEQNGGFLDHYLNIPFDLTQVIFVATANDLSTIEGPLADRLEIIEMSGYSTSEKVRIAEKHVLPKLLDSHGVCPDYIRLPPDSIAHLVTGYTREAGVRQLSRQIASLCRNAALSIAEALNSPSGADCVPDMQLPIMFDRAKIEDVLGHPTFGDRSNDLVERLKNAFRPGMAFGLAWTPYGGELMLIEAVMGTSPSKDAASRVVMTGKLGDVLKESVDVARSWINANAERLGVDTLSGRDIHVHLPAGGVGKDGPSAGCALVTTLFSLASRRVVRSDTALTGEISLSGHVLPVGGIKEKVLGAHRAGLRRVVLPEANRADANKIEDAVKAEMTIEFVSELDQVIEKMMSPTVFVLSKL